ncbi:MAG: outer membrane protein transport protein [Deltaproteobacteria bacterium]|nr:outer membrane protein transport protein [Deltaproteobacteria bacterium]
MKLREVTAGFTTLGLGLGLGLGLPTAQAGGMFLPGSGAISTSRAGAAVASTDDGEALGINPAGLTKTQGTTITISAAIISYALEFQRTGNYDSIESEARPYEGQPYPLVKNDPSLPLGIGSFQPVPVVALVSDLGGRVPGLTVAVGLYAPNAYPFRDMTNGYQFNGDFDAAPPPARYDIMTQEAALLFPSIAFAYQMLPELDIGLRLSWGFSHIKSTVAVWGSPANYEEAITHDAAITIDARDNFVPTFGWGMLYRPHTNVEVGFNFNWRAVMHAKGTGTSLSGPEVSFNMQPTVIGPAADDPGFTRCASGGTFAAQKACVDLQLPMNAQTGVRYKFLDDSGNLKADIELDVGWENWGARCSNNKSYVEGCTSPGQYRVVVDAAAYVDANGDGDLEESEIAVHLKDNVVDHRFKDTYSMRLGGSYHIALSDELAEPGEDRAKVIVRGGVGYDTRAAEEGWLRADIDGAGRTTATLGASYRARKWEVSIGGGMIFEGTNTNAGTCNPEPSMAQPQPGCAPDGSTQPIDVRQGPDPINPIIVPESQLQSPIAQGTFKSSYKLLMLGFSTWF